MFEFLLKFNVSLAVMAGISFALIGLSFRKGAKADRDNYVFVDGFQGLTVATLLIVAVMVLYFEDGRAQTFLRDQAAVVATLMFLSAIQLTDRYWRSLRP